MMKLHQPLSLFTVVVAIITIIDRLPFINGATTTTMMTTTPIPPPPPVSVPVYSLSTIIPPDLLTKPAAPGNDNTRTRTSTRTRTRTRTTSMNIVTFANAASVSPPKLWTISLYLDTLTKNSFLKSKVGVLQLLDRSQKDLVPILGMNSGYDYPRFCKRDECARAGFGWVGVESTGDKVVDKEEDVRLFESMQLLPKCRSYLKVKLLRTMEAGDHEVALCQLVDVGVWDDDLQRVVMESRQQQPPMDEKVVLYTGYLREEGII